MASLTGARILLTGGSGFLGRHLRIALEDSGAIVQVVSRRHGYDLRNEAEALTAMLLTRPSIVIHLAAPPMDCLPATAYRDSVLMGMNLAHAAAIQNASKERVKLIMIGHPASYPTPVAHPEADEETFWNGAPLTGSHDGAVGAAKKSLLQICETYQAQYFMEYSYLIPDLLYGPYENRSAVAKLVGRVLEAKTLKKKPASIEVPFAESVIQPMLYVTDAVRAIVKACDQNTIGGPINLPGPAPTPTMGAIARIVCKLLEYSGKLEWRLSDSKSVISTVAPLKLGRAEQEFAWSSNLTPLETGVKGYIDWCWRSVRQPEAAPA